MPPPDGRTILVLSSQSIHCRRWTGGGGGRAYQETPSAFGDWHQGSGRFAVTCPVCKERGRGWSRRTEPRRANPQDWTLVRHCRDPDSSCYHKRTKWHAVERNLPRVLSGGLGLVWQAWVECYGAGQGHRAVECVSPLTQGKIECGLVFISRFYREGQRSKHPKAKWAHLR